MCLMHHYSQNNCYYYFVMSMVLRNYIFQFCTEIYSLSLSQCAVKVHTWEGKPNTKEYVLYMIKMHLLASIQRPKTAVISV